MDDLTSTVESLIKLDKPLGALQAAVASLPWDIDPVAVLRAEDVIRVLDRFLSGLLLAPEVAQWAELLEMKDFVDYDTEIAEVLFVLANPEINLDLTPGLARDLISRLRGDE